MKLTELLDQIDRLDEEASEAPWQQGTDTFDGEEYKTAEVYAEAGTERMQHKFDRMDPDIRCDHGTDAEFIALARTALPKLAEAVYQVLALLDAEENRPSRITEIDGLQRPARVPTSEVRRAITDALGADDA